MLERETNGNGERMGHNNHYKIEKENYFKRSCWTLIKHIDLIAPLFHQFGYKYTTSKNLQVVFSKLKFNEKLNL